MGVGDVVTVPECRGVHYVDTGMFGTPEYGSVYVIDADRPAVVDSGTGADRERVFDALDEVGVRPSDLEAIALTHVHLDHAGGAGFLAEACPDATVYVHESGARHVVDPTRLVAGTKRAVGDEWEFYDDPKPVPGDRVVGLGGGDEVDLGDRALTAHEVPGHAPHQVAFHDDRDGAVFTGDAAGIWVPHHAEVRESTPPPDFDLEQALADVETIRGLDPEVLLFGHFGPCGGGVDARLDEYRETVAAWVESVEATRDRVGDDDAVVEHLVERADLADVWGDRKARAEARLNARGVLHYLDAD